MPERVTMNRAVTFGVCAALMAYGIGPAGAEETEGEEAAEGSAVEELSAFGQAAGIDQALDDLQNIQYDATAGSIDIAGDDEVVAVDLPSGDPVDVAGDLEGILLDEGDTAIALEAALSPDEEVFADGVRALISIGGPDSPSTYSFTVDLPAGHELVAQEDGSVIGQDPATYETSVVIPAPWAVDAAGDAVPSYYEVAGSELIQHVALRDDSQFPILADPVWFVPLIVAGGRVVGQVAIKAATRAAAQRAAAARAAAVVVRTVRGTIPRTVARRCGLGTITTAGPAAVSVVASQRGDNRWRVTAGGSATIVSAGVGGCLAANIR